MTGRTWVFHILRNNFSFVYRSTRNYWENLKPASGRPHCPPMSVPDTWDVTDDHENLSETATGMTQENLEYSDSENDFIGH